MSDSDQRQSDPLRSITDRLPPGVVFIPDHRFDPSSPEATPVDFRDDRAYPVKRFIAEARAETQHHCSNEGAWGICLQVVDVTIRRRHPAAAGAPQPPATSEDSTNTTEPRLSNTTLDPVVPTTTSTGSSSITVPPTAVPSSLSPARNLELPSLPSDSEDSALPKGEIFIVELFDLDAVQEFITDLTVKQDRAEVGSVVLAVRGWVKRIGTSSSNQSGGKKRPDQTNMP